MATLAPEIPALARDEAFENLYRQYVKDVYHYALALLRNPADAEDVTQTTFMNAYRAFRRGEEIAKPQNWLIKIAHNVARSRYARSARRVKEVPLDDHLEQLALPDDERPNVEGVLQALGRLPFNQRAAIVMRELEGRSYAEIGDTLGVSVPAVETLIFRARRSLRVKASALRSIAGVPVPASLAPLFEGGGLVAGGIGTGALLKAALAIVAGTLATGIGGDHATRAVAAPFVSSTQAGTLQPVARHAKVDARRAHRAAAKKGVVRPSKTAATHVGAKSVEHQAPATATATATAAATGSAPQAAPSTTSSPAAPVTATVSDTADTLVTTVENTLTTVSSALPVQLPPPPQLPVEPPPLPKLP